MKKRQWGGENHPWAFPNSSSPFFFASVTRGRLCLSSTLPNSSPDFIPAQLGFSMGSLSISRFLWAPATLTEQTQLPTARLGDFCTKIWEAACSAGLCWDPALGTLLGGHWDAAFHI